MDNLLSIAIFICWDGEWPWYFPYFIHSCRYNPAIDFLIFTDNQTSLKHLPVNVKIIPYSIEQFKTDASKALGFDVIVESGYKLCDFKPAYGFIFQDYIKNYDFWGYCDIDVIFGNIRAFITDELLSEYDIISARHDYLTDCFALYRNNPYMRELFKKSKDYFIDTIINFDKNYDIILAYNLNGYRHISRLAKTKNIPVVYIVKQEDCVEECLYDVSLISRFLIINGGDDLSHQLFPEECTTYIPCPCLLPPQDSIIPDSSAGILVATDDKTLLKMIPALNNSCLSIKSHDLKIGENIFIKTQKKVLPLYLKIS